MIITMYTVISRWEFDPAREAEVETRAEETMDALRRWDGIDEAYNVRVGPGAVLAVMTYRDEPTYQALIKDPNGPFEKLIDGNDLESVATWIWSESGPRA